MSCIWSGAIGSSHNNSLMTVAHRKITLVCGFVTVCALDLVMYKNTADGKIFYKMLVLFE